MPTRLLYVLAVAVVFSVITSFLSKRRRSMTWTATVLEVRYQGAATRLEDRRPDDWVTVLYQPDDGMKNKLRLRWNAAQRFLPDVKVGDRLLKPAGLYMPKLAGEE